MSKKKPEPDPRIGKLVRYYRGGWHHGTLEGIEKSLAVIRPLGAYKRAAVRCVKVPATDIEVVLMKGEPT